MKSISIIWIVMTGLCIGLGANAAAASEPTRLRLCENLPLWRLILKGEAQDGAIGKTIQEKLNEQNGVIAEVKKKQFSHTLSYAGASAASTTLLVFGQPGGAAWIAAAILSGTMNGMNLSGTFSNNRQAEHNGPYVDFSSRDQAEAKNAKLEVKGLVDALTQELKSNASGQLFLETFGPVKTAFIQYPSGNLVQFTTAKSDKGPTFSFQAISETFGEMTRFTFVGFEEIKNAPVNREPDALIFLDIGTGTLTPETFCTQERKTP